MRIHWTMILIWNGNSFERVRYKNFTESYTKLDDHEERIKAHIKRIRENPEWRPQSKKIRQEQH